MLSEFIAFVKSRISDIILFIIIVLAIMLAFALGYITAKQQSKTPILIQQKQ